MDKFSKWQLKPATITREDLVPMNKISCGTITSQQMFAISHPKYDGYVCGHGPHKNKKAYDRKVSKAQLRKEVRDQ